MMPHTCPGIDVRVKHFSRGKLVFSISNKHLDQSQVSTSLLERYPPCRPGSVLWLFYRGESMNPNPLKLPCGTHAEPSLIQGPRKAVKPSMNDMFTIPVLKWLEDVEETGEQVFPFVPDARLHNMTLQASALFNSYRRKSVCRFRWRDYDTTDAFPYELHVARAVNFAHDLYLTAANSTMGTDQKFPMLSWAATYDAFFHSIWEDILRERGFQLEFRPVWPVLYLQETSPTTYTTAPDVVIAYRGVPLFIIEYVKTHPSLLDEGILPHLRHLRVSMQSALVGRNELQPVFGLLIYETSVIMMGIGYIRGDQFYSKMFGDRTSPMFRMNRPFETLALRMTILNLRSYAQQISKTEAANTKIQPIPYGSPGYNQAYLGLFPVLIDDQSNRLNDIEALQWMLSRRIRLNGSVNPNHGLRDTSSSWISLFVCCDIPADLDDALIDRCTQYLTPRQRMALDDLSHEHLQAYESLRTDGLVTSSAEPDQVSLIVDIQRTACFFASVQDTFGVNFKDEKPCPIRWSILFNSFLTVAWTDIRFQGPNIVEFQCYPSWSMHRRVKSNTILDEDPNQIVPDAAFIVKPDFVFGDAAFSEYSYEEQSEFSDELSVVVNPSIYAGESEHSEVPVLIVEYVKNYSPQGRKSHLVHLSMAMKSAMGLLRALALPPIVLGLLVDSFRITVVCCSESGAEVRSFPSMAILKLISFFSARIWSRNSPKSTILT
ncbi:uncharacterized protein EV420DRAFT_861334 [Desarmillaria tabescens]|uniref:Uncharacterized protein n=1 Tax=Armillaria tabescens TaxID=1929756 RepID=A0AA39MV59_ARMTA|nr:uncharacterized protein EV420DRAFT_861334 [Desarmillaria tabescens]KAK0447812.1 hypothetical protein EV420DRAFT_861334 [Desarmillaria tabescens]